MPDEDVRIAILRHFLGEGRAPTSHDVAVQVGLSPGEVEASFRRLHDAHTIVLAPGSRYIWMANPFSALPTSFRVRSGAREWWGNCIWDALGIVAMLGRDAEVSTACPDCDEPLVVKVRDDDVQHDDPIVHYSIPAARWWDDIGAT